MTRPPSSGPDDFDPNDPSHWPDPPAPSAAAWEKVRSGIQAKLPARVRPHRWPAAVAAVGLIAAGLLVAWGVWATLPTQDSPVPTQAVTNSPAPPADPLAEYDVLPIATAADVMVSVVRGSDVQFGSLDHPIPDTLPLASGTDVTVHRGPTAGELSCPDPTGMAVYLMPPSDKPVLNGDSPK